MLVNADFHVHSCFSMASSKDMLIKNMAPKSKLKGLNLLGTGDAFHPNWLDMIEESTVYCGDGIYNSDDMNFVLTTEVEGRNRIHHLIIIPNIDIARELSYKLPSKNKKIDGRPKTNLSGIELLELVRDYDCLIGPAHAFTPWTGMYKSYDSIYDCYEKRVDFVELGLSADTFMADRISELKDFPFLTNSDAHSPWPHRLGREFNQIELKDISFSSIKNAFKHNKIKANYGLVPNLGKYHMTACTKCYNLIDPMIAHENKMKCSCGGTIKKGVDFRISEIADYDKPKHPAFRPKYVHLMPLAEIISSVYEKGVTTKTVQGKWQKLIDNFGTEIDVLINVSLDDIEKIDLNIAPAINAFRNGEINVIPGGGGKYGQISFDKIKKQDKIVTLDNF
ncbi:TIGR00375 family protein [Methanobrevibacter gottschalkii]|uniref:TIGR00375 family protein n=1 Tax=Methanobrevibacter gottschalkii TaxID=190974 RepID=A0A1H7FHQ6_9EURY|nr:TIGR00375 family protein [Methanobrevibacter gottschalkii]SEK25509.1 TIGR00375 family protein [Methanobrevibacter gottschalkii]